MTDRNDALSVTISRVFAAPRATVFRAWTSAVHMKRWFAPEGCTVPEAEIDCRPGGVFALCMRLPDGQDHWCRGHFVDVAQYDRLSFDLDVEMAGVRAFSAHTVVTFEDRPPGTRLTAHQTYTPHVPAARFAIDGAPAGWRSTLENLAAEVARIQASEPRSAVHATFRLERTYAATPPVVFLALTDLAAKARWFEGGDGWTPLERAMDVRPGGRERARGRWDNGLVTTFDAIYFDVVPDARLVYAYDMWIDTRKISVSLATVELAPDGAGTRLSVTEQGTFLDGYDDAGSRERGTGFLLDRLGVSLTA